MPNDLRLSYFRASDFGLLSCFGLRALAFGLVYREKDRPMRRFWCLPLCLCALSCRGNPYGDHPPHPVSGRILVNGKPANNADITFYHSGDWGEKTIIPVSRTEEDGTFVLSTYSADDGAPNGTYKVEIIWPAYRHGRDIGPDLLAGKYAKRDTSGLTVTIDDSTAQLPPFELKADLSKVKVDPHASQSNRSRRHH
jgi:hypothetical protein